MKKNTESLGFNKGSLASLLLLAALFVYMFAVNYLMPLHRDDYEYALVWGTYQHIATWPDVFQSLYNHYLTHGGRMVDFFVLDSFFLFGKEWFNPFAAILYVALMVLIYWHSQRRITLQFNPYILSLIIVFCWFGLPEFALTNIWMTGICVYLLPAVLILAVLLPYHFNFLEKGFLHDSYLAAAGMFVGGLLAGWTIENTAATMNLIIVGFIYAAYRKGRLTKWMFGGFCGSALGYVLLVAAPGNYVRYAGTNSKLILHFTNQLAAGAQILLGIIPVILFMILAWRILVADYARQQGYSGATGHGHDTVSLASLLKLAMVVLMLISRLNESFVSTWLASLIYEQAIPAKLATAHLKMQLFKTMSGLEEIVLYLLVITQIYHYVFKKLVLRKQDLKNIRSQIKWKEIAAAYPQCYFVAVLTALAVINNLVMLGAPTFPGRAGYGSVVFLIIGAVSVFRMPQVSDVLLKGARKTCMAVFCGIVFIPMAAAVLYQHVTLHQENSQRMVSVEHRVSQGATYLEFTPLSLKNSVLLHVYFVDLNNFVSKYGFCRYYKLTDVKVTENPRLFAE